MDAAILIRDLEPFRRGRPVWDRAAEMIMLAATRIDKSASRSAECLDT